MAFLIKTAFKSCSDRLAIFICVIVSFFYSIMVYYLYNEPSNNDIWWHVTQIVIYSVFCGAYTYCFAKLGIRLAGSIHPQAIGEKREKVSDKDAIS